jgi:hypothetical protein
LLTLYVCYLFASFSVLVELYSLFWHIIKIHPIGSDIFIDLLTNFTITQLFVVVLVMYSLPIGRVPNALFSAHLPFGCSCLVYGKQLKIVLFSDNLIK